MSRGNRGERTSKNRVGSKGPDRSQRIRQITNSSSEIVKEAAALLDEEMSTGILAAKRVQERIRKQQRIEAEDFRGALEQFRDDGHEVISALEDQVANLASKESVGAATRLIRNTHDILDLAVESVNMAAELADSLIRSNLKRDTSEKKKR